VGQCFFAFDEGNGLELLLNDVQVALRERNLDVVFG
jgi:hypothetical protein